MSTTVLDIVTGALKLLEVNVAESAITSAEGVDGLTALNDMMNEWSVDGIDIGYETLNDVSDEVFVTLGSIGAIKSNLAVYIAPEYGRIVTEELKTRAKQGKKSVPGKTATAVSCCHLLRERIVARWRQSGCSCDARAEAEEVLSHAARSSSICLFFRV